VFPTFSNPQPDLWRSSCFAATGGQLQLIRGKVECDHQESGGTAEALGVDGVPMRVKIPWFLFWMGT